MFYHLIMMACLAAIGLSFSLAPLGCFLLWRRQAFFGDALSHSAILGIGISIVAGVMPWWGIALVCLILSAFLSYGTRFFKIPSDSWLGLLSYTLVALGYILLRILSQKGLCSMTSVEHFLFGDVLILNQTDILLLFGVTGCVLTFLYIFWDRFLLVTIDEAMAIIQGINPSHYHFILMLLLSLIVATTLPLVGALLVPGLLIVPAACAIQKAKSPEGMLVQASLYSLMMTLTGLFLSYTYDWPTGPAIMVVGFSLFVIIRLVRVSKNKNNF